MSATLPSRVGAAIRDEFPIFETRPTSTRARRGRSRTRCGPRSRTGSPAGTGNGAEWDFWVERNEAFPRPSLGSSAPTPDDVAVTTSVSQGVSALVSALPLDGERNRIVISEYEFPTVGQIAHAQELRAPRSSTCAGRRRRDPAGAVRGGDRRANGARLLHDGLVPHGAPAGCCGDRQARARPRRLVLADSYQAAAPSTSTSAHSAPTSSPAARSSPARHPRASASCGPARGCTAAADADPDRLVRRRGHLRDVHRGLLAA